MDHGHSNLGDGSQSQGHFPGSNNGGYQQGWNPFIIGYQGPSQGWVPQGFQPIQPNVARMNPNGYAPECFQPTGIPEGSNHNFEEGVQEVAAPTASIGKKKGKSSARTKLGNFNADEDVNLVKSWLEISCDPIRSTGQKRDRMWERILDRYNLRRGSDPERTVRSLQSRWDIIKSEVGLFASFHAECTRENPSGMSDACKTTHAVANFASVLKRKFGLLHCWELMKDEPKWQDPNLRDIATAAQGEGFVDESTQGPDNADRHSSPVRSGAQARRPMGRDSAKAAKKKANSDAGSASSSEYAAQLQELSLKRITMLQEEAALKNQRFQHFASVDERRFDELRRHNESLVQIEKEKIQLMRDKEENKRRKEEEKEDERILNIDLDACKPSLRLYYQTRQEEILEKIAARRRSSQAP